MPGLSKPAQQDPELIAAMIAAALEYREGSPARITQVRTELASEEPAIEPAKLGFWDRLKHAWK